MRTPRIHRIGALILFILIWIAGACTSGELAPQRPFATEAMLMDATLFPPGWRNRSIGETADSHGAIEHVLRDMEGYGTVVHEIYRYKRVPAAQSEYQRQLKVFYPAPRFLKPWLPRPDLTEQLDSADEAHVACASYIRPQVKDAQQCRMLARYGEFVVRFSAQIAPSAAPFLDEVALTELLVKLDDRWEVAMAAPIPGP